MNKSSLYKILAFLVLISELILFFILFGRIQELLLSSNAAGGTFYLLLGLAAVLVIFLFILTILSTYNRLSEDKYSRNELTSIEGGSVQKQFTDDMEEKETLDVETYLKKILPKENSKLDLEKYTEKILSNIAKEFDVVQGLFFVKEKESEIFNITGKYAYFGDEDPKSFKTGETLSGQVAKNKKALILEEIPENYITILSGLGSSSPDHVIIIPIVWEDKTHAIIELASFKEFKSNFIDLFEGMAEQIAQALIKF